MFSVNVPSIKMCIRVYMMSSCTPMCLRLINKVLSIVYSLYINTCSTAKNFFAFLTVFATSSLLLVGAF